MRALKNLNSSWTITFIFFATAFVSLHTFAERIPARSTVGINLRDIALVTPFDEQAPTPRLVRAMVLNLTAVNPSRPGYVTAWPCTDTVPLSSSVNFVTGDVVPNGLIIGTSDSEDVCFFSSVETDLVVDVAGWIEATDVTMIRPTRLLDTRETVRIGPNNVVELDFNGMQTELFNGVSRIVPSSMNGALINITAVKPDTPGFMTVYPCDIERPLASNLNFVRGDIVANNVIATPSSDLRVCVYSSAVTDLVVDFQGWFRSDNQYRGISPLRIVDTRESLGGARLSGNSEVAIDVTIQSFMVANQEFVVPIGAPTFALNVTVVNPERPGYITVYPCGTTRPVASNLNYVAGQTVANNVVASSGASDQVCFYSSAGVDLVVDITGYFAFGEGIKTVKPARFLDTRLASAAPRVGIVEVETLDNRSIQLSGYATNSSKIESVQWQIRGGLPAGFNLTNTTGFSPSLDIPALTEERVILEPELTVTYQDGTSTTAVSEITVTRDN